MENKEFDFHEIKTFEDACKHLGFDSGSLTYPGDGDRDSFLRAWNFYQLLIIQKAINNNGACRNEDKWGFYIGWKLYTAEDMERIPEHQKQKLGIRSIVCRDEPMYTGISAALSATSPYMSEYLSTDPAYPFCFNSDEAARHATRQFEDLFLQYYGIKVKKPKQ